MRPHIAAILALAFATSACDSGDRTVRISTQSNIETNGVLKVVDTLQCPQTQGVLTRKGTATSEGATCVYSGPRGAEVTLQLVRLDNDNLVNVLKGYETSLSGALPQAVALIDAENATSANDGRREVENAAAVAAADADASNAGASSRSASNSGDRTEVRAPGVNITTEGEKATVRLPGLHIEADGDRANVRIGGITLQSNDGRGMRTETTTVSVNAAESATEIRTRAPGEAVRATYLLSDSKSASGWTAVGYEARGPAGGPIVIALIRTRNDRNDPVFRDARRLVTLNVGD